MPLVYKSGRTRRLHLRFEVTVGGAFWSGPASPPPLGTGASYTTLLVATPSEPRGFHAFSSGLGVFTAYGSNASSICIGVKVPSLTGNGFVPLVALSSGVLSTFSVSVTIDRILQLEEIFDHSSNGKRWDVYGASGTCTETYTVHKPGGDVVFTSKDASVFVPGQQAGAQDAFGFDASTIGGRGVVAYSLSAIGDVLSGAPGGVAASCTWEGGFIDEDEVLLFPDPSVPDQSAAAGSTRWGRVATTPPTQVGIASNLAQATFTFLPPHSFTIRMEPRALPDGRRIEQQHRLECEMSDGPPLTQTLYSSGESVRIPCGGADWTASTQGQGLGYSTHYEGLLPVVSRVKVTHIDASRHYFCQVRAPFDVLSLTQSPTLGIPGCVSLSVAEGDSELVEPGQWLGYRFLRVRARSTGGTGTLAIAIGIGGASTSASGEIVTTAADTTETIEIDLLMEAGEVTSPTLTLSRLTFTATGADFVVESVEAFVKWDTRLVCCGLRRGLYTDNNPSSLPIEATPWIRGYTDGVLSLIAPQFNTASPIGWWSQSVRQLVAEINKTTLPTYPTGWGTAEPLTWVEASGSPTATADLTGWSASDAAPPAPGKGYTTDETYPPAAFADSDVYLSALHGDGLVGGATLIGERLST